MDDQVNRKRRTGQLCSKKQNLLSRSVGATDSAQQKSPVDEILFMHVVSVSDRNVTTSDRLSSLLTYSPEDRQRDEEILKRFDNGIGFNSDHAIAFCELNNAPKRPQILESSSEPDSKPALREEIKLEETIELESISTNNQNTKLLSCESITEFVVSTSSKNSAPRHRIKNTIPKDNFEKFLSSLNESYPPMTQRDRILFWDHSPDSNTNDYLDEPELSPAFNAIQLENNNEKSFSSSPNSKLKNDLHIESERILLTINTSTKKMYKSENFPSADSLGDGDLNLKKINHVNDKPSRKLYANASKQSWKAYESSMFKVPNLPMNASKYLTNKIDSNNKEEFYKYLGLETICANGQHEVIVERDKKRRSLRVQRLQMKEDNKRVCREDIGNVEKESQDTNDNGEDINERSSSLSSEPNGIDDNRISTKSEIFPPNLRRACGSTYSPTCIARSLREENIKTTSIIEKFDYSNGSVASDPKPAQLDDCFKSIIVSDHNSRKPRDKRLASDTPKTSNRGIKRFTRLTRKNCLSTSEEPLNTKDNELELISDSALNNVPKFFEKTMQEFLKESRPKTISCIDRMSYDAEENEDLDVNGIKLEQSTSANETTSINDDQTNFIEVTNEKNEPKITSKLIIKMEESPDQQIPINDAKENETAKDLDSTDAIASTDAKIESSNIETAVEQNPSLTIVSTSKLRKRKPVKRRSILRPSRINQTILRSKKILKIMTAKLRIKKPKKQIQVPSKNQTECAAEPKIMSSPVEILKQDPVDSCELFTTDPTVPSMQEELIIPPAALPVNENIEMLAQNLLPNPLDRSAGYVLHAFYEQDFLIVVQETKISFWKYFKLIKMFAKSQNWELLGDHERKLNDNEIASPYKNRLCINETNPVYIEMRARQFIEDIARECSMASVYVNVYYFNEWKAAVVLHSVHLDNICGQFEDIVYTTLTNSRYFIMCWKQETISNVTRTGLCKYSLTPDLNTLASIREFKNMRHMISQLECLSDDKLIGFGETQVTIWDHMTGDVLSNFDFETLIGHNLGSIYYSIEFKNYLLLYQKRNDTTRDPQLLILAVNLSENPHKFRLVHTHDLSPSFSTIKSSLSTNDLLITNTKDGCELLLLLQQPHRIFQRKNNEKINLERFYSSGSQNCVEISEESLIVKSIHEFLMDFV